MMPCLMMSVINSLTNSPSMNPMYIVGLLLINYEVWLSKPGVFTLELKGCCCLAEDCGCVSGLIKLLKSLLTLFLRIVQSYSDSDNSDHPPTVIELKGGNESDQSAEDDESILPIHGPKGEPPCIQYPFCRIQL